MKRPTTLTRHQSRQIDRIAIDRLGIPGLVLMENAGKGVADLMLSLGISGPVVVFCGKGNNGGDGFVIARHLKRQGICVEVFYLAEPEQMSLDALTNFEILQGTDIACSLLTEPGNWQRARDSVGSADWIVDALLGTGAITAPRPPVSDAIDLINESPTKRLSVDLPSGLNADSGEVAGSVIRASYTATLVALKPAFELESSQDIIGHVQLIDIGLPAAIWDLMD